jgi:hypothetical protein
MHLRLDDGMAGGVVVLGRVFVLRRVAAAHVTAREAQAQMHPGIADLEFSAAFTLARHAAISRQLILLSYSARALR